MNFIPLRKNYTTLNTEGKDPQRILALACINRNYIECTEAFDRTSGYKSLPWFQALEN